MRTKTTVLSPRELTLLNMMANGRTYAQIRASLGESSLENVHVHAYNIRQKTGIRDTRNASECRLYIRNLHLRQLYQTREAAAPKRPTARQLQCLRLMAQGCKYAQIALELKIGHQSAQNLASQAAKRIGVHGSGWNRVKAIRQWLERYDSGVAAADAAPTMEDPMF